GDGDGEMRAFEPRALRRGGDGDEPVEIAGAGHSAVLARAVAGDGVRVVSDGIAEVGSTGTGRRAADHRNDALRAGRGGRRVGLDRADVTRPLWKRHRT